MSSGLDHYLPHTPSTPQLGPLETLTVQCHPNPFSSSLTLNPCLSPVIPETAMTCRHGISPSEKLKVPMTSSPILYTVLKMQKVPTFPRVLLMLYRSVEQEEG